MTPSSKKPVTHRYAHIGRIVDLKRRRMSDGDEWVTFWLVREGGRYLSCVAFGEKARKVIESEARAEGLSVKIFGYYDRWTYVSNGTMRNAQRFRVLTCDVRNEEIPPAPRSCATPRQKERAGALVEHMLDETNAFFEDFPEDHPGNGRRE